MKEKKFIGELSFGLRESWDKKLYLSVSVCNLKADEIFSSSDYDSIITEIGEMEFYQEMIEGLNLEDLDEEKEYSAKNVKIYYEIISWGNSWCGGESEYECNVILDFDSYKDEGRVTESSFWGGNPLLKSDFSYSTNKDADFLHIKKINNNKLFIAVGHCCIMKRIFIHPASLTRLLFEYGSNKEKD